MKTSDVAIAQQEVPVINFRSASSVDIEAMLDDESTSWYAKRRMRALQAAGLLPTTSAGWDAKMHPRGRDGKFIEKFGFVRWLDNGKWQRGQVTEITADGHVVLTKKDGSTAEISNPSQKIYSLPRPKGMLNLPGGGSKTGDGTWSKTGGQGGSNPGGKYKIVNANAAIAVPTKVDDEVVARIIEDYDYSGDWSQWKTSQNVIVIVDGGTYGNETMRVLTRVGNDTDGDPIRLVDAVSGEEVDQTTLASDPKASLFVNNDANKMSVVEEIASLSVTPPNAGDEVYVKNSKSVGHAANELLANRFYELAGVAVPETFVDPVDPKLFGSKILPAGTPISKVVDDPEVLKRIQDDMAIDAWLGNWDVAGLTLDNITVIDGVPTRIDAGGSLLFRAQGSPKGKNFTNEVGELETFRNGMNPQSKKIFGGTTDEQLHDGVERIAAISPSKIKDMVSEAQLPSSLADTLIARRDFLMKKFKVEDPELNSFLTNLTKPMSDLDVLIAEEEAIEKLNTKRLFDPALGKWSPQFAGDKVPDSGKSFKSSHELLLEQGDLKTIPTASAIAGDIIALNIDAPDHAEGIYDGTLPSMAYTLVEISPGGTTIGNTNERWKVLNEFTGMTETISMPTDAQVSLITNWAEIRDSYHAYGTDGFKGAINDSIATEETLPKLFAVARANSLFATKPYSTSVTDPPVFSINPGSRSVTTIAALFASTEPRWIAWSSFGVTGGAAGTNGGFFLDIDATGKKIVTHRFTAGLDGEYKFESDPKHLEAYLTNDPNSPPAGVSSLIEVNAYTSLVADAMITRNSVEAPTPQAKTATPMITPDMDLIHADVPMVTSPDGTDSQVLPTSPPPEVQELGTGIAKWSTEETTYDDLIDKIKSLPPTVNADTGVESPAVVNAIVTAKYDNVGVSQITLNSKGQLISTGGKYIDTYALNSNYGVKTFYLVNTDMDLASVMPDEFTFKQDGTIVNKATGTKVGTWVNNDYYGFSATIDRKHSISGKKVIINTQKKSDLPLGLKHAVVDPTPKLAVNAQPIKKSAETLQVESIIKSEGPVTTTNGVDIKPGIEVQSLYSGAHGKVDSYTPGELFAVINAEDLNSEESVKVIVDVKYLKAVGADLPKATMSSKPDLDTVTPPEVPTSVDPSYVGKLYPNGTQPKIGQVVTAGSGAKEMTGEVVGFNKENTYVKVKGPDGVKWRAIGQVSKVVSQPDAAETKLAAQPEIVQVEANLDEFVPEAEPGIPGTEIPVAPLSDLDIYETVPQTAAQKKFWLDGNPKRQLMKGGLAPAIGMPVRVDDGTPMIITGMPKSDSASIILYDPATGKTVSRGAQKVSLDSKKYFGSKGLLSRTITFKSVHSDGSTGIVEANVPHGSIVYKKNPSSWSSRGEGDVYYFLSPDGAIRQNTLSGNVVQVINSHMTNSQRREWMINNLFDAEKIGIASDLGTKSVMTQVQSSWYSNSKTGAVSYYPPYGPDKADWTKEGQEGFTLIEEPGDSPIKKINEAFAKSKIVSVTPSSTGTYTPPEPVKATPGALGKPEDIVETGEEVLGHSPVVTSAGTPEMLSTLPSSLKSNSNAKAPRDAVQEILAARGKKDPASGVRYSLADGDTVEDMSIRFQIVRDANGDEFMEARFKLLEDKAEEVMNGLVSTQGEKGAWDASLSMVTPVELKAGDTISVRRSSSGLLKPGNGTTPNAHVVGDAVHVGTADASGYSLYRVPVVMGDGEYAEMDVELRDSGSINTYSWNKDKVISTGGKVAITPAAVNDGWTRTEGLHMATEIGAIQVDDTGVQVVKSKDDIGSDVGGYHSSTNKRGSTMQRTLPSGTKIRLMGASSNEGGTTHSASDVRRNSFAGDVRVRVPLPKGEPDMDKLLTDLSQGLEAAGLPVEKQKPPQPADLVDLALNKLYKTHAPKFVHRGKFQGSREQLLADLSKRVGVSKEPLTLDDLVFMADSDGRLTVRLSDRVSDAITKQQGNTFYTHNLSGNANDRVIEMLSGSTATGLMATEERWSMGIGTTGMSSATDVSYGSGNGVYATGRKGAKLHAGGGSVIFSARALNSSLEVYTNAGDGFGRRESANTFAISGGNHEYMFKSRLSRDQIAYVTVPDPSKVITALKKRGVTHINGRPIEDIVRSSSSLSQFDVTSEKFKNLGVIDHIATAADLAAAIPPPVTNGPVTASGDEDHEDD